MSITSNNRAELAKKFNLMSESERDFLLSHIKQANPKNIIEIGVYAGGATHFIYEATRESEAKIISVDIIATRSDGFPVGFIMEGINDPRLRREYGKDVSDLCDDFDKTGEKFDFLVLDTVHIHPAESLNFLTIMPYLTENATVILHDTAMFVSDEKSTACKLLFDTVTGEKSEPINPAYNFANIGAFKLNNDTRKYARDVFSMLRFTWGIYPARLRMIWDVLKRNYDAECLALFKSAFIYNAYKLSGAEGKNKFLHLLLNADTIRKTLKGFDRVYFWGFGPNTYCKELVDLFKMLDFPQPCEIWDRRYENYRNDMMSDIRPIQPSPVKLSVNDCVIATTKNDFINRSISATIAKCDCGNFFTIDDMMQF